MFNLILITAVMVCGIVYIFCDSRRYNANLDRLKKELDDTKK